MQQEIRNKVVVITGASSGLGEATARHLAALGARVVLGARRLERLDAIAADIRDAGGQVVCVRTDVTRLADVQALVDAGRAAFGRIDVIVNNAGLMAIAPLQQVRSDEWDRMIDINIKGVLYGIAAVLPLFEQQGDGHVINISSVSGLKVYAPGGTVYSGTKFAVRAISEGLRQELAGKVRVTSIEPGAVQSELPLGSGDAASRDEVVEFYRQQAIPAEAVAQAIAYAIGQPAEVSINEVVLRPTVQDF
ncbi:short-chain dehydrogenase [Aquitalea magnusonii]|uniref:Short-chain dehydrogenase n=1 Tax=Aquitalea magnusonii TaxID=332411 RepID=A0A3G9GFV3_9NEIS|nr:SDR family oxidoreductase [Aquitalea magnusonii]BBF85121.1 short-chain dehydrogenase [Aquitalea magnusonii]